MTLTGTYTIHPRFHRRPSTEADLFHPTFQRIQTTTIARDPWAANPLAIGSLISLFRAF